MERPSLSKKTIAIVLNSSWNIYNFRLNLLKYLQKNGFEIIILAPEDKFSTLLQQEGFEFIGLKHLVRKGKNPISDILLMWELRRIFKMKKIELVLQYTIKPVIYGSLAAPSNTRIINTITGLGFTFLSKGIANNVAQWLYRLSLKKADLIFFQNMDDQNLFVDKKLVDRQKTDVVWGSGIDMEHFQSVSYPNGSIFRFIFVGRLLKDKGVIEFINAAERLVCKYPNVVFDIVGDFDSGNPSSILKSEIELFKMKPFLKFYGTVQDIKPYIEAAHVVVLPSYREGIPRVLLEGMSMSRPLIATDVPGCRETVIHDTNGFLVEVKSTDSLYRAMDKMLDLSHSEREKMGAEGREIAKARFDQNIVFEKYLFAIEHLLSTN